MFRCASWRHVLWDDSRAFNAEAQRRVRVSRDMPWNVGDGDHIVTLGEDEDGKTDDLKQILVPVDYQFSQVNGQRDDTMAALLLAPLSADDDDDEEVLSKNNSSTILRFSLACNGIADKCRFLTGGDAEVSIWEKLWKRHAPHADWLSYDRLLSPDHCSWHSLSHDSWSEMREDAKVSEDVRNTLSQTRSGATIIASSNPIKGDDNDPRKGYGPAVHAPVQGSTISMPVSSKSRTLRVTTAKPRDRAMAAIWQSAGATGRPAERRRTVISAYSRAAALSNGRIRSSKSSRKIASMAAASAI